MQCNHWNVNREAYCAHKFNLRVTFFYDNVALLKENQLRPSPNNCHKDILSPGITLLWSIYRYHSTQPGSPMDNMPVVL